MDRFSNNCRPKYWSFRAVCLAFFVLFVTDLCQAETVAAPCRYVKLATLSVSFAGLRPTIEGSINGSTATMLVDTGATDTWLTRGAVEKLGLSLGHSAIPVFGWSGEAVQYNALVDNLSIGPVRGNKTKLRVVWDSTGKLPYDAIVGADFLFQRDIEISVADRQVTFFHPVGCDDAFLAYWDRNASEVSLEEISPKDHRQIMMAALNGQNIRAMIDTGAARSLIDLSAAARAGITPQSRGVVEGKKMGGIGTHPVVSWVAPFDSFTIGNETIKNVQIAIMDLYGAALTDSNNMRTAEWLRYQPEMLLGADFLRSHRVLFALSQRRLYFSYVGGNVFSVDPEPVNPEGATRK